MNKWSHGFLLSLVGLALPIGLGGALLPLFLSFASSDKDQGSLWAHLIKFSLPEALQNTLWLLLAVGLVCLFLGISCAWFCSQYEFPGVSLFSRLLVLPLAVPSYVLAFVYIGKLGEGHFGGLVFILSLSLFPYVYLLAKNGFDLYGQRFSEVAETFGFRGLKIFFKVILPTHKPWILAGLLFVLLETLANFGAVSIFNYKTLTTVIYKTWFHFFSWTVAAQISVFLVILSFLILWSLNKYQQRVDLERSFEKRKKPLKGLKKWLVSSGIFAVLFFSLFYPLSQLILWSFSQDLQEWRIFIKPLIQSLFLALGGFLCIFFLAHSILYLKRWSFLSKYPSFFSFLFLGYGIPGTVFAVGFLSLLKFFHWPLTGFYVLFLGLSFRFLMVGFKPLEVAMNHISLNWEELTQSYGFHPLKVFFRLQWPLLRGGSLSAFALCFIEILKEMPMTLMMRPFGFDPLSVKIFELTSEGEWERAAIPALGIVFFAGFLLFKVFSGNSKGFSI